MRFAARSNVLNPYVTLGFNYHQFLSLKEDVHLRTTINSSVEEETVSLGIDKTFFGFYAAAGLRKKISRNLALFTECNYEKSYFEVKGFMGDPNDLGRLKAISLKFGILF
ncbi:MAG TPA: hypothetical protein VK589_15995 [Chryseolinea sp.]|nr:hypothetical protein [Chryseolinea sp.]